MLRNDVRRTLEHVSGNAFQKAIWCFRTPGVHAVVNYRFGHWLNSRPFLLRLSLKPFFLLQFHRVRSKWGIEISPEARIGEGLLVFHYGGIFIGPGVIIGKNFTVSHDVTVGLSGTGLRRGAPVIGDNVYVAPGAKIAGRISIGSNVKIGANAVVGRSVPDNALVQSQPVQVVTFPTFYGEKQEAGPLNE